MDVECSLAEFENLSGAGGDEAKLLTKLCEELWESGVHRLRLVQLLVIANELFVGELVSTLAGVGGRGIAGGLCATVRLHAHAVIIERGGAL